MLKIHMMKILLLLTIVTEGISQEHKVTGKINIKTLIEAVDTTASCVVYYKKKTKNKVNGKRKIENKFYIDIPKGLYFHSYKKQGKIVKCYFTNGNQVITVVIGQDKFRKEEILQTALFDDLNDKCLKKILKTEKVEATADRYIGFFYKEKYLVYYYNVRQKDIELFNRAIQSIRKNK